MDSTTIQEQLLQLLAIVLAAGTAWLMKLARDFIKKQGEVADGKLSEQARDRLYPALQYAISYGQSSLTQDEQGKLAASDKLKNVVVANAAGYINDKLGTTMAELGVTQEDLQQMLRARLQAALDYFKVPAAK